MVVRLFGIPRAVNTPLVVLATVILGLAVPGSAAQAQCGGSGQTPCKVWERVPSCNSGLVEDFSKGKCVKPAPARVVKKPVCGGENQRPCNIVERIPSCNEGLHEDFSKGKCLKPAAFTCGALGQRPCRIVERIPSCNAGLAEDYLNDSCVKSNADVIQQLLRGIPSKASLKQPGNHQRATLTVAKDPGESRAIKTQMDSKVPHAARAAATKTAKDNNVITMVGIECRGAVLVGFSRDCASIGDINYPDGTTRQYYMNMVTAGIQMGAALDLIWTTIAADAPELNWRGEVTEYDFYLAGVSARAGVGGTFQLVFDKNWKVIGTRGGPGLGLDLALFVGAIGFY